MVVMCESPEAMTQLFNSTITKTLNDLEGVCTRYVPLVFNCLLVADMVEMMCLSDLNAVPIQGFNEIPAKVLTVVFRCGMTFRPRFIFNTFFIIYDILRRFGDVSKPEKMRPLIEMTFQLVDALKSMKWV